MSFESLDCEENKIESIFGVEDHLSSVDTSLSEKLSWGINSEEHITEAHCKHDILQFASEEVCTKYIPLSDSLVFCHLYFDYPGVVDPGIIETLLKQKPHRVYANNGREAYYAICKEMGLTPVQRFGRELLGEEINLAYYCVDPRGVRPMAIALNYNKNVKILNLTDSFLTDDACYHLGEMLSVNSTLVELNLSGCQIKPSGAQKLFNGLIYNSNLETLNLNKNQLGDDGAMYIANAVCEGLDVQNLYLSYNNIGGKGLNALAEALQIHCRFIVLDLSWNNITEPDPIYLNNFLAKLGERSFLKTINLSWNSLSGRRVGAAIKLLFKIPSIKNIDLSNNMLKGDAITAIIDKIPEVNTLKTLDLSFNPMSPTDALEVLVKINTAAVNIENLMFDNVIVNSEFLDHIKSNASKNPLNVTYDRVVFKFLSSRTDPRDLVLNRVDYLSRKQKQNRPNIAFIVVLKLLKDNMHIMSAKDFRSTMKHAGLSLDDDLINEICNIFPGSRSGDANSKTIDLVTISDYMTRKWPETKLSSTL